jgi:uncharacterized membrane protein
LRLRLSSLWNRLSESLWFIPGVLTAFSALAAYLIVEIDRGVEEPDRLREWAFLFDVGSEGARQTLTAIAQSIITVTGVVFSVTIIALQLTASQFTPRVLRSYMRDRGTQWVLAIFISTFTFTLLVQRTVGSEPGTDEDAFVPVLAVTTSIVLALLSVGALIYFIDHVAQSIRASRIIDRVTSDARGLVQRLFPDDIGEGEPAEPEAIPDLPAEPHAVILCRRGGYLNELNEDALFDTAAEGGALIRMEPSMGHFVLPGESLASIWFREGTSPADRAKIEKKVEKAFVVGGEWTLHQDPERALVELSDIAVRALSPSLNDPTTATMCIDRLGELLVLLGRRRAPPLFRHDGDERVGFIAKRLSFDRAVGVSFEKIRHHGASNPSVAIRLVRVCGRVMRQVPEHRRNPLREEIRSTLELARMSIDSTTDLARLAEAERDALE